MMSLLYFLCRSKIILAFTFLLISTQIIFSQTWIRKIDGFSMWSIGKDYSGNLYAGTTGTARGIFKSTDFGETWINVFSTGASNYLGIACDSLNNVYAANASNGMVYSTDGGQSFTLIPASIFNNNTLNTVACGKNGHIFAGATNGGIWRSTDYGVTFSNTALQTFSIVSISVNRFNPDIIYAGASSTSANGFFISTDGGLTFSASANPINVWDILQTNGNILYTPTTSSPYPFSKSTDGGLTWVTTSNQPGAMRGATLDLVEDIYISGNGGVFKSTDSGVSFVNHNLTFSSNKILTFENKIMVCVTGTTNGGVWIFTDTQIPVELISFSAELNYNSITLLWSTATELNNQGFEIERSEDNVSFNMIGFVPGFGTTTKPKSYSYSDLSVKTGLFYYRLKQIDYDGSYEYSDVVEVNLSGPTEYSLQQNYPNPFNPTTTIGFGVQNKSNIRITILNAIGEVVAILLNEEREPGFHQVEFSAKGGSASGGNAYNLPSGVYFYRLQTGDYTSVKKMILLK